MREVYVDVRLTNYEDIGAFARGIIKENEVRSIIVKGKVDNGSTMLVLPRKIFNELGLREIDKRVVVTYADGRKATKPLASVVEIEIVGMDKRITVTNPLIEEESKILIGNPIIEAMDLLIDRVEDKLKPRHPDVFGPLEFIE